MLPQFKRVYLEVPLVIFVCCFLGFSRVPSTGLSGPQVQSSPRAGSMIGQAGSLSFGTPSHGQNTSSYLPGYLLGGPTSSQMVGMNGLNDQ